MGIIYEQNVNAVVDDVDSSATVVTLAAARRGRRGCCIFNDSTQLLYVKLGSAAATDSYTVRLSSGSYYEVPFGYTGIVTGIWAAANGKAYVTEVF